MHVCACSWGRKSHKSEVKPVKKSDYDTTSGTGQKKFTFLSVFKWESRKGWDILINVSAHMAGAHHTNPAYCRPLPPPLAGYILARAST